MTEAKMTQAAALHEAAMTLAAMEGYEETVDMLLKMYESRTKKRSASGLSKTKLENQELARKAADLMPQDEAVTVQWVTEFVNGIMSPQKATRVLAEGVEMGIIERIEPAKKSGKATFRRIG